MFKTNLGNKETMAKNIKRYMDKHSLDRYQLSAIAGVAYTTVSDWVNAKTYPRIDKIELMANYFGISKADLVEEEETQTNENLLIKNYRQLDEFNRTKLVKYSTELVDTSSIVEEARLTPVATTESAAAGTGYTYGDNEITYYYTDRTDLPSYDFATVIKGDSMEPTLSNGDIALVKQGYDNVNGDIYVIDYDGKSYIKKLFNDGDRFRLISINRNYKNIIIDVPPEDEIYFNIIGKVVGSFTPIDPNNI